MGKTIFWSLDLTLKYEISLSFSDDIFNLKHRGSNESHVMINFQFVLADHCFVQVGRNTLPQAFSGGGRCGGTRGGQYLPRKCSCATCQGPEGPRGHSPNPETIESRPLQAGRQRGGQWHVRPHNTPQPITNRQGGEDEKH